MVLAKFRQRYPQGSLVSELVELDRGTYIVRVSIQIEDRVLATGLAAADRIETAEDSARERAIAALILDLDSTQAKSEPDPISSVESTPFTQDSTVSVSESKPISTSSSTDNGMADKSDRNKIINFEDYPPAQPTQPNVIESQDKFVSSEPLEPQPIETATEPVNSEPQRSLDSGNLFAGTQNVGTIDSDILADARSISTEGHTSEKTTATAREEKTAIADFDFTEMKHKTDLEIKRLGWTKDDGQEFLRSRYGKRSRLQLTDEQLLEFLQYLEAQPSPN